MKNECADLKATREIDKIRMFWEWVHAPEIFFCIGIIGVSGTLLHSRSFLVCHHLPNCRLPDQVRCVCVCVCVSNLFVYLKEPLSYTVQVLVVRCPTARIVVAARHGALRARAPVRVWPSSGFRCNDFYFQYSV